MNLHCEEMELWQTPTHITYMCYSNQDGGWRGIKYRYVEWVKSSTNGVWKDAKELQWARERVNDHLKKLNRFKELHFSIQ